jgi:hypothetical protein
MFQFPFESRNRDASIILSFGGRRHRDRDASGLNVAACVPAHGDCRVVDHDT